MVTDHGARRTARPRRSSRRPARPAWRAPARLSATTTRQGRPHERCPGAAGTGPAVHRRRVGGARRPQTLDVVNASTEEVMARIPQGDAGGRRPGGGGGARGVRGVVADAGGRAGRAAAPRRRGAGRSAPEEIAAPVARRSGCRSCCRAMIQAGLPTMTFGSMPQIARRDRARGAGRQLAHRARAGRRGRRDHAVELPAAPGRREGGAGAGGRLHGRAQAERGRRR